MGSVLLIFLVFCVVFFGGVHVDHLSSFLCCVVFFCGVHVRHLSSFLCCVVFLCFVYLRSVSCVPNVASFSGLSVLDCHFGFL